MHRMVDKLMNQYGTQLVLSCQGEEKTARGFFRAVSSHSRQSMEPAATALGEFSRGQYAYIGPAAVPVGEGDTVTVDGQAYRFCRVEPYYHGGQVLYYWGLCLRKEEGVLWGTES